MKKFFSVLIAVILVLSCSACETDYKEVSLFDPDEVVAPSIDVGDLTYTTYPSSTYMSGDYYRAAYQNDVFYNDQNDAVVYMANTLWHMFGIFDYDAEVVVDGGLDYTTGLPRSTAWSKANVVNATEPTWYEWMAKKFIWNADANSRTENVKTFIQSCPMTNEGYIFSWDWQPYWLATTCMHYDGLFRYINAVFEILKWEGKTDFLFKTDKTTVSGIYSIFDDSEGLSVYEKVLSVMNYITKKLHGEDGFIWLEKNSAYYTFDKEKTDTNGHNFRVNDRLLLTSKIGNDGNWYEVAWDNTGNSRQSDGTHGSGPTTSNYWDMVGFGNIDGYETMLFYSSLQSMAGIEKMLGHTEEAEKYYNLADKVKREFNRLFWIERVGRYGGWIPESVCKYGVGNAAAMSGENSIDFGLTFYNVEIISAGLCDSDRKAQLILDWIDGKRIVEGDKSQGADIMDYHAIMDRHCDIVKNATNPNLRLCARSNTIAFEDVNNGGYMHDVGGSMPCIGHNAPSAYGRNLENGGYIFYPVYYELMSRSKYQSTEDILRRYMEIADVYLITGLQTDVDAVYDDGTRNLAYCVEGLVGEYPENGMVCLSYLNAVMGIDAEYDGLKFAPNFANAYNTLGVNNLSYSGSVYTAEAYRNGGATIKTESKNGINLFLKYKPSVGNTIECVVRDNKNKKIFVEKQTVDENGYVYFDLKGISEGRKVILSASL